MHTSAYADAQAFAVVFLDPAQPLRIADIGSFDINGTLRPIFERPPHWSYVGFDREAGPNVDQVLSSDYDWPEVPSASFDVVVSSQTLEHVPKPWRWLPELARIVRPGGFVYVCTPNTLCYHAYPVDCWRAWPDGLSALAEDAGLRVFRCVAVGMDTSLIAVRPED
jgi:SAM-dependent methyltransferase